ncbi:MAG: ATP citrate lyase citrate-binding domain-containing protein [bacterium]|nr:ATP citrate lyase citrate-binding domain-containing protein [bacterium]
MKLLEHQGLELFEKYGIAVPRRELLADRGARPSLASPMVLKSQVFSGDRARQGGIAFVERDEEFAEKLRQVFETPIEGRLPGSVLAEEKVEFQKEFYLSFSYDTDARTPVLAVSVQGGTGIEKASLFPVDLALGLQDFFLRDACARIALSPADGLKEVMAKLWKLFLEEKVLLAEINPLFLTREGTYVAGDAKIILDDNVANPEERPYLELGGDIAVLASGGGASLINLDALMHHGGRPANYVEYSGNPPAEVVDALTQRVFAKPGLKGAWVVGGTANFTDIYETMRGFVEGLRKVTPKPAYPIVIRRDGPRQKEAFLMLREVGEKEGYDFHLYGPEVHMAESARIMVELAYGKN